MFLVAYGLVALFIFVLAIVHARRVRAVVRRATIFRHLELIVRQNLPLPMALSLASQMESGKTRRALANCSQFVQLGLSLSEALRRAYPKCPGLALSIVQAAERTGTLPSALLELGPRMDKAVTRVQSPQMSRGVYSMATVLVLLAVVSGVGYYVVPKFISIFSDFEQPMPRLLLDLGFGLASPPATALGWIVRLLMMACALAVPLLIVVLISRLRPRRAERVAFYQRASDYVAWHVWPLSLIARNNAWQAALPTIRLAVSAGWPLADAAEYAAGLDVNICLRGQLLDWARRMRGGEPPVNAALAIDAPDMLVRTLSIGVRDGDLDAPLCFAESYFGAITHRWRAVLAQLIWPVVTLFLAVPIGLLAYSLIGTLAMLINKLCDMIG